MARLCTIAAIIVIVCCTQAASTVGAETDSHANPCHEVYVLDISPSMDWALHDGGPSKIDITVAALGSMLDKSPHNTTKTIVIFDKAAKGFDVSAWHTASEAQRDTWMAWVNTTYSDGTSIGAGFKEALARNSGEGVQTG